MFDASSQELLAAIVDGSDDAIVSKTLDGTIISWNAGAERLFGYTSEEAVGRHITMLFPPERLPEEAILLARIGAGERVKHFETERVRKDGRLVAVSVTLSPVRDGHGRIVGASKIVRDISERRRLEEARAEVRALLDEQRRRLSEVFAQLPVAIATLRGQEHRFDFANTAFETMVAHREVLGRPLAQALPELAARGLVAHLGEALTTGQAYEVREERFEVERTGDGPPREAFYDLVVQPIQDPPGAVRHLAMLGFDVTELVQARRTAEAASRAKDEFLAMLGHELRNPLAPILTALQLLHLRGVDAGEHERTIIERQVTHLVGLVDDLLDVSRITRGRVELRRENVEVADVVAQAIEMASPLLEQYHHDLRVSVPRRGLPVDGDPGRLAQVVANLLTNAAKYTEPGGRIDVNASTSMGDVVLGVRDTGIGIEATMLPRVFDLFSQERQALDRSRGGLGLGLAIVRSLVELHGGTVSAASEGRGQGSLFTVRLPLAAAQMTAAATDEARPVLAASGAPLSPAARVLIVDDNEDAADLLARALALYGFETRAAHDAADALHLAPEFAPDVAILDIGLPVMDGFELAARFAGDTRLSRTRLIAVTGYGQERDVERSKAAGFDFHLVKPVDLLQLRAAVTDLVARS